MRFDGLVILICQEEVYELDLSFRFMPSHLPFWYQLRDHLGPTSNKCLIMPLRIEDRP